MSEQAPGTRLAIWLRQWKKYRYAALVLLLGIGLMLFPKEQTRAVAAEPEQTEETPLAQQLEELLSRVEGAGQVRVLLTLREGSQYTYQTDQQTMSQQDRQELETKTVLVSGENGTEAPLVTATTYPVYQGAVVVCQGADSAYVRLNIISAVSSLTGLGSDKISVIKMKSS